MIAASTDIDPGTEKLQAFDKRSGSWIERLLFNNRGAVLIVWAIVTVLLGYEAHKIDLQASFERMIPTGHPYIANYLAHKEDLKGQGNAIRIAIATDKGSIFDPAYLETLRKINDEVFLTPGVDRPFMKSLWTQTMRWIAVTEDGLDGGPVMVDSFDGSPKSIEQLRLNIERSGEIGQLVAPNFNSTIIFVPLLDPDPRTGQALDYGKLSAALEQIRSKYERDGISLHITGFGKIVGDLIAGLRQVLLFFGGAILICTGVLYAYTRCVRSTLLVVVCSLIAVMWLCGILALLGRDLDPYSILVPFLVFAIGMSHGAQKMNGVMQDIGRGAPKLLAARMTFRRLFLAGLTALLADAVGFAVLMIIGIRVIQDLAIAASIGVAVLIFTNLVLLPILLSYTGVSLDAARRSLAEEKADASVPEKHFVWALLDKFCSRKWAGVAIGVSAILGIAGLAVAANLKIGDLDPGAPELRADSRYNRDNAFLTANYGASSDTLVVMVATPPEKCSLYGTLVKVDALEWALQQLPGVEATNSFAGLTRRSMAGLSEGNLKWSEILRNQDSINAITTRAPRELFNQACDMLAVYVFLKDHKADTLTSVVQAVEAFAADNDTKDVKFLLGAGNAGIEAATNIVVKDANHLMLVLVYAAVILLAFITFRSWRAVVCAVAPLVLTSILCEALMVGLGIGVKVATLPVIALGVGIGVDYALYVLSITLSGLRAGASLSDAYYRALLFTGRVVLLTGGTLATAVAVWAFSPIKFQADMGVLLAFMFLWNMLGALILLAALASFLLAGKPTPPRSSSVGIPSSAVLHPEEPRRQFANRNQGRLT